MLKTSLLLVAMIALSACNMMGEKHEARTWVKVSCIGFAGWDKCKEKAKQFCPNGYESSNAQENMVTQNRSMMISCN